MDARQGAAVGIRLGAAALETASGLTRNEHAWVIRATGAMLDGVARVLEAGNDWSEVRRPMQDAVRDTLGCIPDVRPGEARQISEGIVSAVDVVRRWAGLS